MEILKTSCCAIADINGLAGYSKQPEKAMDQFCKLQLAQRVRFGGGVGLPDQIYSFYMFTAAVWTPEQKKKYKEDWGYYYDRGDYGDSFAAFIKENDLGSVWESDLVVNEAFHPDHGNKVWIWTPNLKNLRKWWDSYQEKSKPKSKSKTKAAEEKE